MPKPSYLNFKEMAIQNICTVQVHAKMVFCTMKCCIHVSICSFDAFTLTDSFNDKHMFKHFLFSSACLNYMLKPPFEMFIHIIPTSEVSELVQQLVYK